jgi:putative ABC transport system substrate-binding protein
MRDSRRSATACASEGRSYRLEARFSDGRFERLPDLARELLRLNPDIAVGAPVLSAQAFWRETKTVPIVIATGSGALQIGMIASLARPGETHGRH